MRENGAIVIGCEVQILKTKEITEERHGLLKKQKLEY